MVADTEASATFDNLCKYRSEWPGPSVALVFSPRIDLRTRPGLGLQPTTPSPRRFSVAGSIGSRLLGLQCDPCDALLTAELSDSWEAGRPSQTGGRCCSRASGAARGRRGSAAWRIGHLRSSTTSSCPRAAVGDRHGQHERTANATACLACGLACGVFNKCRFGVYVFQVLRYATLCYAGRAGVHTLQDRRSLRGRTTRQTLKQ